MGAREVFASAQDRYLIVPKLLFFLCSCQMYASALYHTRYLAEVWDIPAEYSGRINFVVLLSIPAALAWSGLADKYRAHKRILILKSCLFAASYLSLWLLEPVVQGLSLQVRLGIVVLISLAVTQFCSAVFPLLSTLVLAILEASPALQGCGFPAKQLLGRQKLFGTIGVATVYFLNGYLTDFIAYRAQFLIVLVATSLFCIIAALALPETTLVPAEEQPIARALDDPAPSVTARMYRLVRKPDFALLLFLLFSIGFVGAIFNAYFSVFMGMILAGTSRPNGSLATMAAVRMAVEIPIYLFGNVWIQLFGSYGVLLIGTLSSAVRAFGYAFLVHDAEDSYRAYLLELLKGAAHSCNGLAGSVLASDLADSNTQGLAQALITSAHHHSAYFLSGVICSQYLSAHGASQLPIPEQIDVYRSLFLYAGLFTLIGVSLNTARLFLRPRAQVALK